MWYTSVKQETMVQRSFQQRFQTECALFCRRAVVTMHPNAVTPSRHQCTCCLTISVAYIAGIAYPNTVTGGFDYGDVQRTQEVPRGWPLPYYYSVRSATLHGNHLSSASHTAALLDATGRSMISCCGIIPRLFTQVYAGRQWRGRARLFIES
jgi:hypothetical protein